MQMLIDHPLRLICAAFLVLWLATQAGRRIATARGALAADEREDFSVVLGATLTLLGLIIGFSFSMATSRYDQRKTYEEAEANAIGTAYARADLLPATAVPGVKALLREYTALRVQDYQATAPAVLQVLDARTASVQRRLWQAVVSPAAAQPTPLAALVVSAVNDVLNSQGYTQAAWWNRIPLGAWVLLLSIGAFACAMLGYGSRTTGRANVLPSIMPAIVAVSLFLIADIDSPREGVIRVIPQNLIALAQSLD